ncbi:MAG: multicopper oxidase domain-containing protein [Thaumarchaeota archaeon]|nr:multicopper oxidase domain-containing protein [Nitrososphaerota archaeon]
MSQEATYYRTTPARTAKMMVIMLGICIAGGAIFFAMWDYWISEPAPVVAMLAEINTVDPGTDTGVSLSGKTISTDLVFVESSDLLELGFNALPGEEGSNPTITANVGDTLVLNIRNDGNTFHAFGITQESEGFRGVIHDTHLDTQNSLLHKDESGVVEYQLLEEGTYYYICSIPGHRQQGLSGQIIVGPAEAAAPPAVAKPPTGVSHEFVLDFVESDDFLTLAFNALPGEEGSNPEIRVNSGDEVTISATNLGRSFHSFGVTPDPDDFNNVLWDSDIAAATNPLKPGEGGTTTFTAGAPGSYYYICTVPGHAVQGMQGSFIVE